MTSTPKTTSFTRTGTNTQASEEDFEESAEYPEIFGITVTPKIGGIACALVGVAAAAYILVNMVFPVQEAISKLEAEQQQKQGQINQLKKGQIEQKLLQLDVQINEEKSTFLQVLGLFANQKNLDTLLIDIGRFINKQNSTLLRFQPSSKGIILVEDGSFGSQLDGKIRLQGIDLEVEGDFQQSQTILQNIERLQPLLIVKNMTSEVTEKPKYIFDQYNEKIEIKGQPKIKTSFRIDAILPPPEEEISKLLEPPKAEESPKGGEDKKKADGKK